MSFVREKLDCVCVDFEGKGSQEVYKSVHYFLVVKVMLVTDQNLQERVTQHVVY
jgi:hypothetical protein